MLSKEDLDLLDKIQHRTIYENKFFEKRYELKWFDELKKRGYFKPNPGTKPQESEKDGFFFKSSRGSENVSFERGNDNSGFWQWDGLFHFGYG